MTSESPPLSIEEKYNIALLFLIYSPIEANRVRFHVYRMYFSYELYTLQRGFMLEKNL